MRAWHPQWLSGLAFLVIALTLASSSSASAAAPKPEEAAWNELQAAVKARDLSRTQKATDVLVALKTAPAQAAPAAKTAGSGTTQPSEQLPAHDIFDVLEENGFSLSRSPDEEKKGARFGFTQDRYAGSDPVFDADFYLKWQKKPYLFEHEIGNTQVHVFDTLAVSVQGKLTSTDDTTTDAWRFRLEDRFWTYHAAPDRLIDGLIANISLKDDSDRDLNVNRLSAEVWLTVNKAAWFIGKYSGHPDAEGKLPPMQFRWRPYVGLDAGGVVASDSYKKTASDDPLWGLGRLRADLNLVFLQTMLHLDGATLYVDDKFVYVSERERGYNYLTTGIDFEFNEHIGFTLDYTHGADSPKFKHEEMLKGGLTVGF